MRHWHSLLSNFRFKRHKRSILTKDTETTSISWLDLPDLYSNRPGNLNVNSTGKVEEPN